MNKKVIELLATTLKLDVEELTKAITTEEDVDFNLPDLKIFSKEDYESTIEQIKDNHGKTRYDAGKLAGSEMTFKDASEKIGLETPVKDIDGFMAKYKDIILKDANVKPNEKIKELEGSVSKLQEQITEKETKITEIEQGYKIKEARLQAQTYFPDIKETLGLSKEEQANLYFMSHEQREDGIYKNGERLKDDHEKPLTLEQSISNFIAEKKWVESKPSGRGGGAGSGSGETNGLPKNMKEYEQHIAAKSIAVGSEEANALLQEMAKANPESLN